MTDKRNRSSLPPPPQKPLPSSPASTSGETHPVVPPPPPVPALTNGVGGAEDTEKVGVGGTTKPKPPSKPSKLARAFSSGTIGRIAKAKKKKNADAAVDLDSHDENGTNTTVTVAVTTPVLNGNGTIKDGMDGNGISKENGNGKEKDQPWKLPGIEAIKGGKRQHLKSPKTRKASSSSEPSIVDRELPPVPRQEEPDCQDHFERRELPPIPQEEAESPPLRSHKSAKMMARASWCGGDLKGIGLNKTTPTTTIDEAPIVGNVSPLLLRDVKSMANGEYSSLPETTPTSVDSDPSNRIFRPLPKTPPLSECDDDDLQASTPDTQDTPSAVKLCPNETESPYVNVESPRVETSIPSPPSPPEPAGTSGDKVMNTSEAADQTSNGSPAISRHSVSSSSGSNQAVQASNQQAEEVSADPLRDYTIGEIVSTYAYALPVRVTVLQGYCSDTTDVNISTDDVFHIHSVEHMKKVVMKDEDGMTHRISLEAPVKVGLVYNPSNNYDMSLDGYSFKNIAEVTSMPVLPKVIAATQGVNAGTENSVSEGETFVIKTMHRSMFKGKKGLKVFSITTRTNKVLLDDCIGHFSTKPSLVKMDLPDLLEVVTDIFPSRGVLYPTSDNAESDFPGTLSRLVSLLECSTDTTLKVSDVSFMSDSEIEEANTAPIPLTSPASFDLLLDSDISSLEVAVQRWTYPEDIEAEEELAHVYANMGVVEDGEEEPGHLYDDTTVIASTINSSEDLSHTQVLSGSTPTSLGSGREVVASPRTSVVSAGGVEEDLSHTYMNLKQQQQKLAASVNSGDLSNKEKIFIEEDEDAGYDTVGLHLIGAAPQPAPAPAPAPESTLVKHDPGYPSLVEKGMPKSKHSVDSLNATEDLPSPSSSGRKESIQYSTINQRRAVTGVTREVTNAPDVAQVEEGTGGVAGGEESQVSSLMENLESRLKSMQNVQQSAEMTKMQSMLEMLTTKLEAVDSQLHTLSAPPKTQNSGESATKTVSDSSVASAASRNDVSTGNSVEDVERCNREYLKTLDEEQVSKLMTAMSLGQYKEKVLEEHISGEILVECDDAILQDELGVASRIHRIRIAKIISGQHSAKALLEKE